MSSTIIATPEFKVVEVFDAEIGERTGWMVTRDGDQILSSPDFGVKDDAVRYCDRKRAEAKREALVAGLRSLADWLEEHPDVPCRVLAYHHADGETNRERAKQQLADVLAAAPDLTPTADYRGEPRLERDFGPEIQWNMDFKREAVGTPRIEDGAVVWDLPPELVPPTPDAAESGEETS